jgi:hypothetical protein
MKRYDPEARKGVIADDYRAARDEAAAAKTASDKQRQQVGIALLFASSN